MKKLMLVFAVLTFSMSTLNAQIEGVENPNRANVNYMLNCQGCHGPTGAGTADGSVPVMADFVGKFLLVPGGRKYLVQVPGSANAPLSDQKLAELLNWMLWRVSPKQVPANFVPYNEAEVGRWRAEPLQDVVTYRAALIDSINKLDALIP